MSSRRRWSATINTYGVITGPHPWAGQAETLQTAHGRAERGTGPSPAAALEAAQARWRAFLPRMEQLLASIEREIEERSDLTDQHVVRELKDLFGSGHPVRVDRVPNEALPKWASLLRRAIQLHAHPLGSTGSEGRRAPVRSRGDAVEGGKKILLVEDDEYTREIYQEILVHRGFQVSTAVDGGDAVRLARREGPDLILLDIALPTVSGWHVASMLKDREETRRIPVVAISGNTRPENQERAESLGLEAYFNKPFTPTMVLAAVQRVLGIAEQS